MIKVLHGDDTGKSKKALNDALFTATKEFPDSIVTRFDDVQFDPVRAKESLLSASLFGATNVVVLDGVLQHPEGKDFYLSAIEWASTPNMVIVRETALHKDILDTLTSLGAEIQAFMPPVKMKDSGMNFVLADALLARDKRTAWVEFALQEKRGAVMEEMHGTIFWAFKTLYLVKSKSKEEAILAGVKDFSYRKNQNYAKNFIESELEDILGDLKDMYHRAHHGEAELGVLIEQFILKL